MTKQAWNKSQDTAKFVQIQCKFNLNKNKDPLADGMKI